MLLALSIPGMSYFHSVVTLLCMRKVNAVNSSVICRTLAAKSFVQRGNFIIKMYAKYFIYVLLIEVLVKGVNTLLVRFSAYRVHFISVVYICTRNSGKHIYAHVTELLTC